MRRLILLATLMTAGTVAVGLSASQQPTAKPMVVEVEKLHDKLFVLKNGGGNTAVFITAAGVVVVDTKNPGWGQPLITKIREVTDKPVTTLINTHTHGDHVSGNVEFPATVEVITHANTAVNMQKMLAPSGFQPSKDTQTIFQANGGRGLPKRTFTDKLSIGQGADQIDLLYFGRGHTNGDTWIVFPALRTMHAGDIFPGKSVPIIDGNNGGSGVDMPATLTKAADFAKDIDVIITGHSTQMTVADLREYAQFNQDFVTAVQAGKKAERSVDDIAVAAAWALAAKYPKYPTPGPGRLKSNVEVTLAELR